jgi:hypothetical protein
MDELARQYKRHETNFQARVEPHPDHAPQFRLSFPDALSGLDVIDVSAGGLGIRCGVFIPRNLRIILHISDVNTGDSVASRILAVRAVARRCTLIDHKPTYQIGLQFLDPTGPDEVVLIQAVEQQKRAKGQSPPKEAELQPVAAGEARGV